MEVVLPTCIGPAGRLFSDLDRARILARSLERYLRPDESWTIHVIAADEELDEIRAGLRPFRLDLRFHRHSEVLPGFSTDQGWVLQQFLKLGASCLIRDDFYLTLDSDHILTRRLGGSDIIRDGRAMVTPELRERHETWWQGASEILGTSLAYDPVIALSCACLSTPLVRGLLERLSERLGEDWMTALMARRDWTEYALYYTFAQRCADASRFHFQGELLGIDHSVWFPDQFESWDVDRAFEGDHYFIDLQSTTDIPPELIRELTARYLGPWPLPTDPQSGSSQSTLIQGECRSTLR
jgi:hypothetical protein